MGEVEATVERINRRFRSGKWQPIVFLKRHHTHAEVDRFYRAADVCLVTSLHDGMNLVAKEYIASRYDEGGMLVLSPFTGAARELPDALIVNPYDTERLANAIFQALEMDAGERQARMRRMRHAVQQHNVYRWAGNLIGDLCDLRLDNVPGKRRPVSLVAPASVENGVVMEEMVYQLDHTASVRRRSDPGGALPDGR
jgi:trehalose 6-phosphate synthase